MFLLNSIIKIADLLRPSYQQELIHFLQIRFGHLERTTGTFIGARFGAL